MNPANSLGSWACCGRCFRRSYARIPRGHGAAHAATDRHGYNHNTKNRRNDDEGALAQAADALLRLRRLATDVGLLVLAAIGKRLPWDGAVWADSTDGISGVGAPCLLV